MIAGIMPDNLTPPVRSRATFGPRTPPIPAIRDRGDDMIFDLRIYTIKSGKLNAWLAMYEQHAYPIQLRHLGKPVMFSTSEIGPLNQAVHLWAYADLAEREKKRNAMQADPEWGVYLKMNAETAYIQEQENRILRSTSFSPL
jgi:hypothetical protein